MKSPKSNTVILVVGLMCSTPGMPADLSPVHWPPAEKTLAEQAERSTTPSQARSVESREGLVAATMSPIAVLAGVEALRKGGTAADAAAAVALTQVTTAAGSYVSLAGILQLVYYDAASGQVTSLDAGWNSWHSETKPSTIPASGFEGRRTLVPGFMAGVEAMQKRYGRLAFGDVLQPAIWYAENGITVTPLLSYYFGLREKELSRTEEGRRFLRGAGNRLPRAGDRFVQTELAATLRGVAKDGASWMYSGPWGQQFVEAIRRESGGASIDDMKSYRPMWDDAGRIGFLGNDIYLPSANLPVAKALRAVEQRGTWRLGPYWKDARAFQEMSEILANAQDASHSDSVVVIDQWGNMAALVHSINAVVWGTTGIVAGGVPVPDAASINKYRLMRLTPGSRVPHDMAPAIVLRNSKPVLATAAIGSSLTAETVRLLVGILGNRLDAATVMAAPPLLYNYDPALRGETVVPEGAYDTVFLRSLEAVGMRIHVQPKAQTAGLKGTAAIGLIDENGNRRSLETPGVSVYAAAQ